MGAFGTLRAPANAAERAHAPQISSRIESLGFSLDRVCTPFILDDIVLCVFSTVLLFIIVCVILSSVILHYPLFYPLPCLQQVVVCQHAREKERPLGQA